MGKISITQDGYKTKINRNRDLNWEKESYKEGCQLARRQATTRLKEMEDRLYQVHPTGWRVIGFRDRTLVTRFGEFNIRRRLYRDSQGDYHFLLDEHIGWFPQQLATPDLEECLVELATQITFKPVSKTLEKMTAGTLSDRTIQRLVHKIAKVAIDKERKDWQTLFSLGDLPSGGDKTVPVLFSEGDGTFIHLQREDQKHFEVKQAICYEGWEKLSGKKERYKLIGKRVYCQGNDQIPFWEGAGLEWSRKWDLGYVREIVIGGDGASDRQWDSRVCWSDPSVRWFSFS
jgi:hypothetical protein